MTNLKLALIFAAASATPVCAKTFDCDAGAGKFVQKVVPILGTVTVAATVQLLEPRDKPPFPPGAGIRFRSTDIKKDSGLWLLVHPDYPDELTLSFRKFGERESTVIGHFPMDNAVNIKFSHNKNGEFTVFMDGRSTTYYDNKIDTDSIILSCNSGRFIFESDIVQ